MNIDYSIYTLQPIEGSNRPCRKGSLLRVHFSEGFGYADCHPWPELGDLSLENHLQSLAKGEETSLVQRSLAFAEIDYQARMLKYNLFQKLSIPASHVLIADIENCHHVETLEGHLFKLKMGYNLQKEMDFLTNWKEKRPKKPGKISLDFNARITEQEFREFLHQTKDVHTCIDFIEDPFSYHPLEWQSIQEEFNVPLACDRDSDQAIDYPNSCDFLVIKPAIQEMKPFLQQSQQSLIITSCLDHPIGQLGAAYIAAQVSKSHPSLLKSCGLLSHHAYEITPFSSKLSQKGVHLVPSSEGYGWGYDDLLEDISWKILK